MFYYSCKRCKYFTKQKICIKRHLDKKNKCMIINKDNILSDNELYNLSLQKELVINLDKNKEEKEKEEDKKLYCKKCDKYFHNKSNLQKHIKKNICNKNILVFDDKNKYCETCNKYFHNKSNLDKHLKKNICNKNDITYNNITINNINTTNIINYININCIKGFDEDWDVSNIDHEMKEKILLSNSKFSKTLENILNNDVNLNVILNDDLSGIVYKNEKQKYELMAKNEILLKSMDKIFKHLKIFYDDIINNNINELSPTLLKNIKKEFENKYNNFFNLSNAKEIVNNSFTVIYNNKKDESTKKYSEIINKNICNKNIDNNDDIHY
jgi:hypothetical protein